MADQQDWHTESYKGMEVHVTALPHGSAGLLWDYSVRIAWPGDDSTSEGEILAACGDDADYPSPAAALEAGFVKGHALIDALQK